MANPLSITRQDVEFKSEGVTCRAWLNYPAVTNNKNVPIVIMAHGFGGTREMLSLIHISEPTRPY